MERLIFTDLLKWKQASHRKVLILRGARQVGKTYIIRELGKTFDSFLEVNFEKDPSLKFFFEGSLDPIELNRKLSSYFRSSINPQKTLLFFDEIQSCPNAIKALRFYKEDMPDLHVIAAGSLLEFALSEISSFGVGRLSSLFMYPLSFAEFLLAHNEHKLRDYLLNHNIQKPLDLPFHTRLLDYYRTFQLIGGMPQIVNSYLNSLDPHQCQNDINELIETLKTDFSKYKKRASPLIISETFESVAQQAGRKFKYSNVSQMHPSIKYKEVLDLLEQAGLVHKIYHSACQGLPLGAQIDPKKFKAVLCDLGMHQQLMGLDLPTHLISPAHDLINKGSLAEIFVGLEILAYHNPHSRYQLNYWHREAKSSNAEVDYVIQNNDAILPLEVKSASKGQMQSLHLFLKERKLPLGVRLSHENFGRYANIQVMPLYAVEILVRGV